MWKDWLLYTLMGLGAFICITLLGNVFHRYLHWLANDPLPPPEEKK